MRTELNVSLIKYIDGVAKVEGCKSYEVDGNKIPKKLVDDFVDEIKFETTEVYGKPTTVMYYKLSNGFIGTESTTSVDPKNYSLEIGSDILRKRLEEKIWFGLGFALGMASESSI